MKGVLKKRKPSCNDIYLNRCTIENTGFLPEMLKLGDPTSGAENDCTGPHFILEENMAEATDKFSVPHMDNNDDEFKENRARELRSFVHSQHKH